MLIKVGTHFGVVLVDLESRVTIQQPLFGCSGGDTERMNRLVHTIQNARIKSDFNANRTTLHTNGGRPKDVRTAERDTRDELQVTD